MTDIGNRAYVLMDGTPFERGLSYGRTLKKEINELIVLWKKNIKRNSGMDAEKFIPKFLEYTDYITAVKEYTPELFEEVKGLAEGCGQDFDTMFTFQLLDELILNTYDAAAAHCSSIGVNKNGDNPVLIAQNWDIESFVHGYQTVLHIKEESGTESYIFTYAGLIAAFGMNNRGIGICLNSIPVLKYSNKGLPVAYVIRSVLSSKSRQEAVAFINNVNHASPQNYIIADENGFEDYECSNGSVVKYSLADTPDRVYHTNHQLSNSNFDEKYNVLLQDRKKGIKTIEAYHNAVDFLEEDSGTRYESLKNRLSGLAVSEITIEKIVETLSSQDNADHPVCMDLGDETKIASIVSTVMEMKASPVMHIAFGPPNKFKYKIYKF